MNRIICIGQRYCAGDVAGPAVYDRLVAMAPPGVEVIDGGLAGLGLLRFMEGARRVVFVDTLCGFGRPQQVMALDPAEVASLAESSYGHSAGLPYLLRALPAVCEGRAPEIAIVGIEGAPDEHAASEAATLAVALASAPASGVV
jgi:hydrogenase maturation protease